MSNGNTAAADSATLRVFLNRAHSWCVVQTLRRLECGHISPISSPPRPSPTEQGCQISKPQAEGQLHCSAALLHPFVAPRMQITDCMLYARTHAHITIRPEQLFEISDKAGTYVRANQCGFRALPARPRPQPTCGVTMRIKSDMHVRNRTTWPATLSHFVGLPAYAHLSSLSFFFFVLCASLRREV